MKALFYTLFLFLCFVANTGAQTFGLGNSAASQPSVATKQSGSSSNQLQNTTGQAKAVQGKSSDSEFMQDSVVNFSRDDNDKKYDNSLGKVIRFKIVDGEVQFQEDKDRKILIYYDNYKVSKGMDNVVRCTMRLFVLNDLETKVSNLSFKLRWPEISTSLQMQRIEPGVNRYTDIMLLGNGCFTMDKTPTVEINRCRVKGLSEEQCADKVKWFAKSRK